MKMRQLCLGSLLFALGTAGSAANAGDLPQCAGEGTESAKVERVTEDGALMLTGGRVATLEGVRLPKRGEVVGERAVRGLSAMATGKFTTLAVSAPKQDRHGRLRAHVWIGGEWVQEAMLREGWARVSLLPTHPQCAKEMYAAEAAAREARRGLWTLPEYAVRSPEDLAHDRGTFQIVEGKVVSAVVKGGRAYLNFSDDWKNDFTVTIAPDDMKAFRKNHVNPRDYAGKTIRVRGLIDWYRGPEIELMGPESIEVLH